MISEEILIADAQKGDETALTEIVEQYSDRLFTLLYRMLGVTEEAEDALQETFITMIKKISAFKKHSSLYTWLYRIATNVALMRLRKIEPELISEYDESTMSEKVHNHSLSAFPEQPDAELSKKEFKNILDSAVKELSPEFRSVFVLRDMENVSTKETAEMLKISIDNVKTRLRRARMALRDKISERIKK